jgi:hypothetical protein
VTVYELYVVETEKERDTRQALARPTTPEYKQHFIVVGQNICGLQHYATRPNQIFVEAKVDENNLRWFAEVLLPCADENATWYWG